MDSSQLNDRARTALSAVASTAVAPSPAELLDRARADVQRHRTRRRRTGLLGAGLTGALLIAVILSTGSSDKDTDIQTLSSQSNSSNEAVIGDFKVVLEASPVDPADAIVQATVTATNVTSDVVPAGCGFPLPAWITRSPSTPSFDGASAQFVAQLDESIDFQIPIRSLAPASALEGMTHAACTLISANLNPGETQTGFIYFDEGVLDGLAPGSYSLVVGSLSEGIHHDFEVTGEDSTSPMPADAVAAILASPQATSWLQDIWSQEPAGWSTSLSLQFENDDLDTPAWYFTAFRQGSGQLRAAYNIRTGATQILEASAG